MSATKAASYGASGAEPAQPVTFKQTGLKYVEYMGEEANDKDGVQKVISKWQQKIKDIQLHNEMVQGEIDREEGPKLPAFDKKEYEKIGKPTDPAARVHLVVVNHPAQMNSYQAGCIRFLNNKK